MPDTRDRAKGLGPRDEVTSFVKKDHCSGPDTPPGGSITVDLTGPSKTDWVLVKVNLPTKLYEEIVEIITYLGLWKNLSEFIRFALLIARNQWIDEMRRAKRQVEEGR